MKTDFETMRRPLNKISHRILVDIPLPLERPMPCSPRSPEDQAVPYRKSEHFKALVRHHAAKRRTAKMTRLAPWADEEQMKAIYKEARRLTKETGIEHHVDHYYPLQGHAVSGLHVPANLRIIPASENISKSNDMPDGPECW